MRSEDFIRAFVKMRCFIAIDIPEEFRQELISAQDKLRKVPGLSAKFVEPENLHLTLKFLGEIYDSDAGKIKEKLSKVKFRPFKVHFGKAGVFPSEGYVRVIWISLEPSEELMKLSRIVNEAIGSKEERFESHITLVRVRNVADKEQLKKALQEIKIEKKVFEVKEIKLKKSTLSPSGPIYEDIGTFQLK